MNEALIKATFFLSVLSTENPEFPSVPLDPPQWRPVFTRKMTLQACADLSTRYRLPSLRAECDWDMHQLDSLMWFYYLQACASCGATMVGFLGIEQCESYRKQHLAEGAKTSQACFQNENQPPDPVLRDCLERIGTENECKG